jgi:hypothetical protein
MIMAKVEEKTLESMENSVCEVKQLFDLFVRTPAPAVVKNEQIEQIFGKMEKSLQILNGLGESEDRIMEDAAEIEVANGQIEIKKQRLGDIEKRFSRKLQTLSDLKMTINDVEGLYSKD